MTNKSRRTLHTKPRLQVANTEYGDLNVSIYTYVRYLNQLGLNANYTGRVR